VSLLTRASRRWWGRHPWQLVLSVLGVALGVAVVLAIDLTNASATRAFRLSSEAVTGAATHRIVGGPRGLDEALYVRLRTERGLRPSAPVVTSVASVPGRAGETFQLLGVDPLAEAPFRPYLGGSGAGGIEIGPLLTEPGAIVLARSSAERLGVEPGERLRWEIDGTPQEVTLVGVLDPADELSRRALAGLALADIATVQELAGKVGRLDRIDLILPEGDRGAARAQQVGEWLPEAARVVPTGARSSALEQMTRAFQLNLSALSLLALFVGLFLIYNTMTFSVVQRRELIGSLRTLGTTRPQVGRLILGEAFAVGIVGTALGLPLGLVLAQGLLGLVTQTINDLYFVLSVRSVSLPPLSLLKAIVLGVGAAVVAALAPTREATLAPPLTVQQRSSLEESRRGGLIKSFGVGITALVLAALLLAVPTRDLVPAFAGVFALLAGCALVSPLATVGLTRLLAPLAAVALGPVGRIAVRGIERSLSRHAVAIAALMTAISVTVSVGIMIGSFRSTVERWLDASLRADVYVSPADQSRSGSGASLDPELVERLRSAPGVARSSSVRRTRLLRDEGRVGIVAFDFGERRRGGLPLKRQRGAAADAWSAFHDGAVFVTEPYAYRHGVDPGEEVTLPTERGERRFDVAGIVYDYSTDQGLVMMARSTYERFWDDPGISGLGLYVAEARDADALIESLRPIVGDAPVVMRSNRAIRQTSMEIFDRTFTVTAVLRLLALVVAFMGVVSAQLAIQLESRRQTGLLRAVGLTPGQLWRLVGTQTGSVGLIAGLQSIPLGIGLGAIMIFVVNRRSFGWTMTMEVDPWLLAQGVAVAVGAAVLAGLYPSWALGRVRPAEALRSE
jgi:putative ABC transport system permease protein